jgi:6-phosphogluconolactonase (cycloisomerase 2 family)/PKD repeat protein
VALAAILMLAPAADASRVLFAADGPGNRIFGFGVGTDGGISALGGFPITNQQTPSGLVPSPDGTKLYASVASGVQAYSVSSDGTTTPDQAGVIAAQTTPSALAIDRAGTRLFVTNAGSGTVSRYTITPLGLSPVFGATATGTSPDGIAITPDGAHVYVANGGTDHNISILDGTGAATGLTAEPAGNGVSGLAITPDGTKLYAANTGDDTISGWTINSDGTLDPLLNSPYTTGDGPHGIAISPDGRLLLSADTNGSAVSGFAINANGSLASRVSSPVVAGVTSVAFAPDGRHAFAAGSSQVGAYDVSAAGALSARGLAITTTGAHTALAVTPNQGPEAKMDPVPAPAGSASTFAGGPSTDPDGTVKTYAWDFGDGSTGTGATGTHTYAQPGTYDVRLTVTDDEGCSTTTVYTGQATLCTGSPYATITKTVTIPEAPPNITPEPPCIHDGNDGFCGTPDQKAPSVAVLGFNDGQSLQTIDAPDDLVGTISPDPSGTKQVLMRFTKAAGTIRRTQIKTRRVCRKVHGKRRCTKKKVKARTGKKVPACLTVSGNKSYLVRYECSAVQYFVIQGDTSFRYSLPVVLGIGSYRIQVIAIDGAGNSDVLEKGRNDMTLNIVKTSSNDSGTGGTTTTPSDGGGSSTPITDTGSPFGHR